MEEVRAIRDEIRDRVQLLLGHEGTGATNDGPDTVCILASCTPWL
jgi:hypothetical protein